MCCARPASVPPALCLELTESALMDRETDTVEVLERIRAMGVYVAIDDFGTEYSSLARLRGLPVEVLKIDRSFIDGLPAESGDTAIVTSILSLALAMGKHVIAEGVERPEQAAALRDMGCTVAQGYLFSMPVDPWEILPLLGRPLWQSPAQRAAAAAARGTADKRGAGIVPSSMNSSTTSARPWVRSRTAPHEFAGAHRRHRQPADRLGLLGAGPAQPVGGA